MFVGKTYFMNSEKKVFCEHLFSDIYHFVKHGVKVIMNLSICTSRGEEGFFCPTPEEWEGLDLRRDLTPTYRYKIPLMLFEEDYT